MCRQTGVLKPSLGRYLPAEHVDLSLVHAAAGGVEVHLEDVRGLEGWVEYPTRLHVLSSQRCAP